MEEIRKKAKGKSVEALAMPASYFIVDSRLRGNDKEVAGMAGKGRFRLPRGFVPVRRVLQ